MTTLITTNLVESSRVQSCMISEILICTYFEDLKSRERGNGNVPFVCFNRFCWCSKMLFRELKMRFVLTAPIELVWYIRNIFECLEGSKCLFYLKYELHSCSFYLFQKLSPPKFLPGMFGI
jgi:hypothetical protein